MADHYEILGVGRQASAAEIRQAYARLARERHPDRFQDAAEKERAQEFFKLLTTAFNCLFNERNRREYDAELERPKLAAPEEIARQAYERGLERFQARDYHAAIELLRSAVTHAQQTPAYHAALARALSKNPHWVREAIQSAERAAQLAPKLAAYQVLLADLYLAQGLKLRARRYAEAALRLAPEDAEAQRVMVAAGEGAGSAP